MTPQEKKKVKDAALKYAVRNKEYRVSVTHFVNTKLKPQFVGKQKEYPLYIRIVYRRKTTNIRSLFFDGLISETRFAQIKRDENLKNLIDHECEVVAEIVSFYFDKFKINVVEQNSSLLITPLMPLITEVLSRHIYTSRFESEFTFRFPDLSSIIDFKSASFDTFFDSLVHHGNHHIQSFMLKFQSERTAFDFIIKHQKWDLRVYHWLMTQEKSTVFDIPPPKEVTDLIRSSVFEQIKESFRMTDLKLYIHVFKDLFDVKGIADRLKKAPA